MTTPAIESGPPPSSDPPPEVHGDVSSKGTLTDEASQDGHQPTEGNEEVHVDLSSEGTATVAEEVGSSKSPETDECRFPLASYGDFLRLASTERRAFAVTPTIVVKNGYRRLFTAAASGYWKLVEKELTGDSNSITAPVMTVQNETYNMLDIAIMFAHDELVEKLVEKMDKHLPTESDVEILRKAFFTAARTGRIKMVKALHCAVKGNAESGTIEQALCIATQHASEQKEVISYLAEYIKSFPNYETMRCLIMANHLDIILSLAERFPSSSKETENLSLLLDLVKMMSYFCRGAKFSCWEETFNECMTLSLGGASNEDVGDANMDGAFKKSKKSHWNFATKSVCGIKIFRESHLRHQRLFHLVIEALSTKEPKMETPKQVEFLLTSGIVLDAASRGMTKIVWLCLKLYPELMWEKEFTKKLLEEIVRGRHVDLFRLVNSFKPISYLTDDELIRHLMEIFVASQPENRQSNTSTAEFLMQKELQWFKALENRSNPSLKSLKFEKVKRKDDSLYETLTLVEAKESKGKTYWEVFVEERKGLLDEAEKRMKKTSSSCILVATLFITITFAAAFTVPGGNNNSTGIPILIKNTLFRIFIYADGLALFYSIFATWMFLAILTSSYRVIDFGHLLPAQMILGLTFLFVALAFMLVAFTSAYSIVSNDRSKKTKIPSILLAAITLALIAIVQQLPLYVGMVIYTFWPPLQRPLKLGK